jgi:hypothetical protein
MKNIKINILDFRGNNHWNYEILIDDKRFAKGWYQYDLSYKYQNLERFPNGVTEHQRKILNNKYALIMFTNSHWAHCFIQEAIDLVIQKIYELYYDILKKQ